ncbi:MAG: hydroxyacylglutathione hydrolase [Comamonadaceae bacterium]
MKLIPLPAFSDNYIWLLHDERHALVVDPGDAEPVLAALQEFKLELQAILVTHHHPDHTGGVAALRQATGAQVFGPQREAMPQPLTQLSDGARVQCLGLQFEVIDVPGHTAGHIAYYTSGADQAPILFSGDTLFSGGCGRLFEGTPAQMLVSLKRLSALPDDTRVCCAHEYTLSNLKFACAVEPGNAALQAYFVSVRELRSANQPSLPSALFLERQINPFLRTQHAAVIQAVRARDASADDEVSVFAALRQWKNQFQ